MYWFSGDEKYQDPRWEILLRFKKNTSLQVGGFSSIGTVQNPTTRDTMESYCLGDALSTCIFCFLMTWISSTLINVLNIEGHPLPIWT